ncbi:MAG: large-conductance mechanosensitive channel protein MscL [Ignavibacteriae bacterium]|nr:large-conductance mechanosensitive channel protein MscL [Ignavibacteriota bacterium]
MMQEFKAFAMRGNVLDLAIGVIIGTAFGAIVSSLVADVIMPIVGILTGGVDFSGLAINVGNAAIAYGKFIQAIFIFLITAWALFLLVKGVNRMKRTEEAAPAAPAAPSREEVLLTEIRDALRSR